MPDNPAKPLYFLSLYFRLDIYSGANKRFTSLAENLYRLVGDRLRLIVSQGEAPDFLPPENVLQVAAYTSPTGRLKSFLQLRKLLRSLPPGLIVSDFMPIPFSALKHHDHFQLIHDLRNFTEFRRGGLSFLTAAFQRRQLRKSQALITVSEQSKLEIMRLCGIASRDIVVSYNGISRKYFFDGNVSQNKYDILYVAIFEERKNHLNLVHALALSPRPLRICFVGSNGHTRDMIKSKCKKLVRENGFTIDFIDQITEDDLIDLYQRSRVYACPSLLEGFGMPLVEAMANQCQIACSDIPVFREICGDSAHYFDPRNPDAIWASLNGVLSSAAHREKSPDLRRFSWPQIASQLLEDMEGFKNRDN